MPLLAGRMGRVSLRYDPSDPDMAFFARDEPHLVNHKQLPQFLPRTQWLNQRGLGLHKMNEALRTDNTDWSDPYVVEALHRDVDIAYPNLQQMEPFRNNNHEYDGVQWRTHVAAIHGVMFETIAKSGKLDDMGICALLRTISYGMYDTMTFFKPWRVAGPVNQHNLRQRQRRPDEEQLRRRYPQVNVRELSMDMTDGTFSETGTDQQDHLDRMMGRRWIVAPIRYADLQWGMTMFDRLEGQLYIFNCVNSEDRILRIEACVHLWTRFWTWLGMSFSFLYYAPGVSGLPDGPNPRNSGLASAVWVMFNLRNQVGHFMKPDNPHININDLLITEEAQEMPLVRSQLPLHDWVPDDCSSPLLGIKGVEAILQTLCCNELGLDHAPVMTKKFGTDEPPNTPLNLLHRANGYMSSDVGFPRDEFWTGNGGPQFSLSRHSNIKPYDDRASRAHYRSPMAFPSSKFKISKRYDELTRRRQPAQAQARALAWPQKKGFTVDQPYNRGDKQLRLMVEGIEEMDEQATQDTRYIQIRMRDGRAQHGVHILQNPIWMVITSEWRVQDNGVRVVRLDIEAAVGGDRAKTLTVDFPLPLGF